MARAQPMYSLEWFETFAMTVPDAINAADLDGIADLFPVEEHPRLIDVCCGVGRIAGPLTARGYAVTGIDISVAALQTASRHAPGPRYVALDQRHVGHMRWEFDAAIILWSSIGFVDAAADRETLSGIAAVLRPGGRLALDLYHPGWMRAHSESRQPNVFEGVSVRRWMEGRRCCHEMVYADGHVDHIQFDIYEPEEIRELARAAGLEPERELVWWKSDSPPSAEMPRYQLVCVRP